MSNYGGYPGEGSGLGGFLAHLGDRVNRRAEPRVGISLAGVGMLMIVVGVIAWAGEQAAGDGGEGDSNRTLGIILSLLVIAAGYLLLVRFDGGPLATAGVVAVVLGVPVLMGFVTFDADPANDSDAFITVPFQVDAIALLSLATWLASYLWVPVARGRAFFVAASTFVLWLYLMEKVEEGASAYLLTFPWSAFAVSFAGSFDSDSAVPDYTSLGGPSLIMAIVYYGLAVLLDRQGHRGLGTPFTAAGFAAMVIGIAHLAPDLEGVGTGILLILVGAPLALYGATQQRRFTTWAWAFGVGFGILVIVGDLFEENIAGFGIGAIILGAAVILGAHLFREKLSEPDEMTPGPSKFTPRPRPAPAAAWTGYPQQPGPPQWTQPPYAPPPGAPPTTGSTPAVPPTSPGPPTTGSTPTVPPVPPTPTPPTTGQTPVVPPERPPPPPPAEPPPDSPAPPE